MVNVHGFQMLAIAVIKTTIEDYRQGDKEAAKFLFVDNSGLDYWCQIAGVGVNKVRERAKSDETFGSMTTGRRLRDPSLYSKKRHTFRDRIHRLKKELRDT